MGQQASGRNGKGRLMFIANVKGGYDRYGQQRASGKFLLLCQCDGEREIRGLVRHASLRQLGQFMMGSMRAFGHSIPLSGAYGNDGLPRDVPRAVWERATPLPPDLYDAWNHGGGWNGPGREAAAMRAWGIGLLAKK